VEQAGRAHRVVGKLGPDLALVGPGGAGEDGGQLGERIRSRGEQVCRPRPRTGHRQGAGAEAGDEPGA
jgi:hypothetical protein